MVSKESKYEGGLEEEPWVESRSVETEKEEEAVVEKTGDGVDRMVGS